MVKEKNMKTLMENWKRFLAEKKKKKIPHSWATHGRKSSGDEIGEVLNHSLTEDGGIEMYEVKFSGGVETVPAGEFIVEQEKLHEHEARSL